MNRANKINMRKNKICSFRWKYVDFSVINIMFILCLFYSRKKTQQQQHCLQLKSLKEIILSGMLVKKMISLYSNFYLNFIPHFSLKTYCNNNKLKFIIVIKSSDDSD